MYQYFALSARGHLVHYIQVAEIVKGTFSTAQQVWSTQLAIRRNKFGRPKHWYTESFANTLLNLHGRWKVDLIKDMYCSFTGHCKNVRLHVTKTLGEMAIYIFYFSH